jgi:hypothetical protein
MLRDFLKGNHFKVATATMPWLWKVKGLACPIMVDGVQLVCIISIAVFKAKQGSASTQHPWEKDAGVLSRYRSQILARGSGMLSAQVRAQIKTPGQVST